MTGTEYSMMKAIVEYGDDRYKSGVIYGMLEGASNKKLTALMAKTKPKER
jgi:hypothetical protein